MYAARFFFSLLLLSFVSSSTLFAQGDGQEGEGESPSSERPESRIVMVPILEGDEFMLAPTRVSLLSSFDVAVTAGPTFATNTAAQAAFDRAVGQWEALIADPITVTIDAQFGSLGSGTLATAAPVSLTAPYNLIRDAVVIDSLDELDDTISQSLPNASQASFDLPNDFVLSGNLEATKANLKALGFTGLDAQFGASDGVITFGTGVSFDFDNSDGVTPGFVDFESVAAHEIGHLLGFATAVDTVDSLIGTGATGIEISPTTFDLYRFEDGSANDPLTASDFTTFARSLVPNSNDVFDQVLTGTGLTELSLSTGLNAGDGFQASHFEDNLGLGALDPTLATGEVSLVNFNDARVLDLIGYEIGSPVNVPEPGMSLIAMLFAGAAVSRRRRS